MQFKRNPQKHAAAGRAWGFVGFQICACICQSNQVIHRNFQYDVGPATQISGCQEPLETDSSRTKNILSRCMNPSLIFHGAKPFDPC